MRRSAKAEARRCLSEGQGRQLRPAGPPALGESGGSVLPHRAIGPPAAAPSCPGSANRARRGSRTRGPKRAHAPRVAAASAACNGATSFHPRCGGRVLCGGARCKTRSANRSERNYSTPCGGAISERLRRRIPRSWTSSSPWPDAIAGLRSGCSPAPRRPCPPPQRWRGGPTTRRCEKPSSSWGKQRIALMASDSCDLTRPHRARERHGRLALEPTIRQRLRSCTPELQPGKHLWPLRARRRLTATSHTWWRRGRSCAAAARVPGYPPAGGPRGGRLPLGRQPL